MLQLPLLSTKDTGISFQTHVWPDYSSTDHSAVLHGSQVTKSCTCFVFCDDCCFCYFLIYSFIFLLPPLDGAAAACPGGHDREVSLALESASSIPLHHRLTLQFLLSHLTKVAQASNGLDVHVLGQIFGPLLMKCGASASVWASRLFRLHVHALWPHETRGWSEWACLVIPRLDDQFACLVVEKLLMERTREQDVTPPRMSHVFVDLNMDQMQMAVTSVQTTPET